MAVYEYKGVGADGKAIRGVFDADGPRQLRAALRKEGIYLTEYSEERGGGRKQTRRSNTLESAGSREVEFGELFQRIKIMEVALVTRSMATLIKAGIPVVDSLSACVEQSENPKLKKVLTEVKTSVNEGAALSKALAEHPKVFTPLYINMISAGESSGTLDIVFARLADFVESQVKLRTKLIGTLMYPAIMLIIGFVIVTMMMVFVIPKITEMFEEMGAQLPFITRVLIALSEAVRGYWYVGIALLALGAWRYRKYVATEVGRKAVDAIKLRVPVFGDLLRMVAVARFTKTFATLLSSGVPLLAALDIVKNVLNNVVLAEVVDGARVAIKEGEGIAGPLVRSKQFPPLMTHMIAIGERSGQLEEMLDNVAGAYETQVDSKITQLTAILEPVMIVLMGVGVAFLVFAILMPMMQLNDAIGG